MQVLTQAAQATALSAPTEAIAVEPLSLMQVCPLQVLAQTAPEEVLATLRAPLAEALADLAQEADRGRTFAAAEVLGGLVASGAVFAQSSGGVGGAGGGVLRRAHGGVCAKELCLTIALLREANMGWLNTGGQLCICIAPET